MNELHRQAYLSALGIEGYMPRWHLPSAPISVACVMPIVTESVTTRDESIQSLPKVTVDSAIPSQDILAPNLLLDSLIHSDIKHKPTSSTVNAAAILQQLEEKKSPVIQPFSLSVWRPQPGFLIIDERNTNLALPTELLLGNILRTYIGSTSFVLDEEVMRWPMIENRFVPRTADDARNELQTWLAVENELRPISCVWLMGSNATSYFLSENKSWDDSCWQKLSLDNLSIQALILPSLNSLLKQPSQKARLWACL